MIEQACPASGQIMPTGIERCPVCDGPLLVDESGRARPHVPVKSKAGLGIVEQEVFQTVMAIMNAATLALVQLANDCAPKSREQTFVMVVIQLVRGLAGPTLVKIEASVRDNAK